MEPIQFETEPSRYQHLQLAVEGDTATISVDVQEDRPMRPGYELKLNSYDLGVDIELADAVQRLRFEHPEVRCVVVTSGRDRVFCAGANIHMLASSSHAFKVNFCKYTNETRLYMEDASRGSGLRFLAACNGPTAGGGYELALACDEILLIDDGSSAVSLPEVPLLAVLPGTGGLTRVVDKRKVRRDRADVFSTVAEGIRGKRAVEWRLIDGTAPKSKFADLVSTRKKALAKAAAAAAPGRKGPGVALPSCRPFEYVELVVKDRVAELTVHGPRQPEPETPEGLLARGAECWALRAFRELDQALLDLRFNHAEVAVVLLRARGDARAIENADRALLAHRDHWFVGEILLHMGRVLRRLDLTAKSFFAVAEPDTAFAGSLAELFLAADRTYVLDDAKRPVHVQLGALSSGVLPMSNGLSRLASRLGGDETQARSVLAEATGPLDQQAADEAGLVTVLADEIDFEGELRVAVEERVSMSPDALTGMEANFRFVGPETMETKIFGRLSAWQNWIFSRANATGPTGALTRYGKPERPVFDIKRT
jgi:benzoyl-CoA-dihydrodiol lyase